MSKITRRALLEHSAMVLGAAAMPLPSLELPKNNLQSASTLPKRQLKVVVVGGHPDDPESGCGGTIALYSNLGHQTVNLYLTRGERGIEGKSLDQVAAIRTAESEKACSILKTRAVFAGQIDGDTEINGTRYAEFRALLEAEHPDIVLTHWPIDSHPDHRAASLLVYDAWLRSGKKFELYYYEVDQGEQSQVFRPTHYVDITLTETRKRAACMAHVSQAPETTFYPLHDMMNRFRGMECGVKYAEGFLRHCQNAARELQ